MHLLLLRVLFRIFSWYCAESCYNKLFPPFKRLVWPDFCEEQFMWYVVVHVIKINENSISDLFLFRSERYPFKCSFKTWIPIFWMNPNWGLSVFLETLCLRAQVWYSRLLLIGESIKRQTQSIQKFLLRFLRLVFFFEVLLSISLSFLVENIMLDKLSEAMVFGTGV